MTNIQRTEQMLRDLFSHHASHEIENGDPTPFIDVYINDDVILQFSYGALNLAAAENADDAKGFLSRQEQLTYEAVPDVWLLSEDWTGEEAFTICIEILNQLGHDIDAVTYAVEQDCPSNGTLPWDVIGDNLN